MKIKLGPIDVAEVSSYLDRDLDRLLEEFGEVATAYMRQAPKGTTEAKVRVAAAATAAISAATSLFNALTEDTVFTDGLVKAVARVIDAKVKRDSGLPPGGPAIVGAGRNGVPFGEEEGVCDRKSEETLTLEKLDDLIETVLFGKPLNVDKIKSGLAGGLYSGGCKGC